MVIDSSLCAAPVIPPSAVDDVVEPRHPSDDEDRVNLGRTVLAPPIRGGGRRDGEGRGRGAPTTMDSDAPAVSATVAATTHVRPTPAWTSSIPLPGS